MSNNQEATFEINDSKIFCRIFGQGAPLLLLHGFFQSSLQWDPYLEMLGEEFRLIVPDLPGHGKSTNPASIFTHRQAALDIYRLLDLLDIGACSAVGYSSGSMILLHMATQQPERIKSIVLFCPTPYFPEQARKNMQEMIFEKADPAFLEFLDMIHPGGEVQIQTLFHQFQGFALDYDDMNS